nr:ADYC domain-containing protein [Polyangiaceae bacterium]
GIYIGASNNSSYCFADDSNPSVFCPERFVSAGGGVRLESRAAELPDVTYSTPVHLSRFLLAGGWVPVELISVQAKATELEVRYQFNGTVFTARGADLSWLRFEFPAPDGQPYGYEWVIDEVPVAPIGGADPPRWLKRYESSYRLVFEGPYATEWRRHCVTSDIPRQASFLGGTKVDGLYADVASDKFVTTVSCETGAIDTCLTWGYTPWGLPNPGENIEESRELYGACLQAKRAAYFAGPEGGAYRLTSFTVPHTPIVVRDTFGVMGNNLEVEHVEAVWGPEGARCLNPTNARVPKFRSLLHAAPSLPPCDSDWRKYGRLVTGRPTPPPP